MKISYNWLQNYFEEKLPTPEELSEGIIFHSFEVEEIDKVGDDTIFDIKVLPDRAHDCLSHFGIAKEISAIFDLKIMDKDGSWESSFKNHPLKIQESLIKTELEIKIENDKCLRYMGRIIRNIKVTESPDWLREKLKFIGQKSINNVVDALNFVMFDLGQPIHAFDLDKLESLKIIIRNGKVGEKIITLDKKEINLDESILVIADDKNPLAIAGIKGGTQAEVDNNTKNIVIEVANFNHTTTRKTAKKINIQTDAVKRYENEISPELCSVTMDAITGMIFSLAGGEVEEIVDVYPKKQEERFIVVGVEYINKRLGSDFTEEEIRSVWDKLKFEYKIKENNFEIKIPVLRLDLIGPHDLVEEVIRILGYDRLEGKLPEMPKDGSWDGSFNNRPLNEVYFNMINARIKLLNDGYSEIMTYVFQDKGDLEVLASASDKKFLRTNLTDGLKESMKLNKINLPLLDIDKLKIFEIGTIFKKDKEIMNVAYGDEKNITEVSLEEFVLENIDGSENSLHNSFQEVLGRGGREPVPDHLEKNSASEFLSTQISHNEYPAALLDSSVKVFKTWSVYPFITRDIAVWVPQEIQKDELVKIYKEFGTELLVKEPKLFDEFKKEDKVSYGFRLVFQSYEKTLTDEEISLIMSHIEEKISSFGWVVR